MVFRLSLRSLIFVSIVGWFCCQGKKEAKEEALRGSQLQDLDVVVFLEVNTSRNMRLLEQPGGQLERSPETV